jgi:hypothetical protein
MRLRLTAAGSKGKKKTAASTSLHLGCWIDRWRNNWQWGRRTHGRRGKRAAGNKPLIQSVPPIHTRFLLLLSRRKEEQCTVVRGRSIAMAIGKCPWSTFQGDEQTREEGIAHRSAVTQVNNSDGLPPVYEQNQRNPTRGNILTGTSRLGGNPEADCRARGDCCRALPRTPTGHRTPKSKPVALERHSARPLAVCSAERDLTP